MSRRLSTRHSRKDSEVPQNNESGFDEDTTAKSNTATKSLKRVGVKSFYTQEQREKSFAVTAARKRQSNAKKGSKAQKWSWPTNHPSPELMARAGFYFKPAQGDEDNVACFLCQKNMSEWDPEDDPSEQHVRHNNSCGWALTMCRELVIDGEIASDPFEEEMVEARRMTFDNWWPHDGKKGWKPTVENVIMAGFVFRPQRDGDDTVYCPYCKLSIDEWEQDDDPREVHKSLGSGDCLFLRLHKSVAINEQKETADETEAVQDTADQPGPKKRTSRARKNSSNPQRKRAIPKSRIDPEEYQDLVFQGGEIGEDMVDSAKPSRGKKRGSSVMEDGGVKPLFDKDDRAAKIFQEQQQYIEDQGTPRRPPTKRRVTRASIATNQSELDLIVNVPTHLAHDSDDEVPILSLHNTPVKPKGKAKKKATRTSSASAKGGRGKKQVATKEPLDFAGMDDDEIDRALELDILDKNPPDAENDAQGHVADTEGDKPVQPKSPERKAAKSTGSKGARRLTRTKPAPQEFVSPEPETTEKPKPRRKRLTRTKPTARVSIELANSPALESPAASPEKAPVEPHVDQEDEAVPIAIQEAVSSPSRGLEEGLAKPQLNGVSLQANSLLDKSDATTAQNQLPTPIEGHAARPSIPKVSLDDKENVSATIAPDAPPKRGRPSRKRSSAQAAVTTSAPTPSSKAKDMKRKSDAIVDNEQDGPTEKKRRRTKKSKSLVALKDPSPVKSVKSNVKPGPMDATSVESSMVEKTTQSIAPLFDNVVSTKDLPDNEGNQQDANVERQPSTSGKIIAKPKNDSQSVEVAVANIPADLRKESTAMVKRASSSSGDSPIEAVASNHEKSLQESSQRSNAEGSDSQREDSPADTTFQDSVPNTQFSAVASQATMATSFQGSNKGVSFTTTAEDQLLAEQEASFANEDQEQSLVLSPKVSRTPLSVIRKPHNGALALMTPRNRGDEMAFAPVQTSKPWKSTDLEIYLDDLKENGSIEVRTHQELSITERKMTTAQWIMENAKRAEKQLIHNGDMLIKFFEDEAQRAIAAIEAIETSD